MNHDNESNRSAVFIGYSHKDERWKNKVKKHISILENNHPITFWDDSKIKGGDDWYAEIEYQMNKSKAAIFLVSANFLGSEFILREEVVKLITRRIDDGIFIIPLLISPCDWKGFPWLSKMQLRPKNGKPLSSGNSHQIDVELQ